MNTPDQKRCNDLLERAYPFHVSIDEESGYVIEFPDLPGCVTQVETLQEIPDAAEEIRTLWIETALDHGQAIPSPSLPPVYSGKFNVRLPRALHRSLVESAASEGVSLNQHVVSILAGGSSVAQLERRLDQIEAMLQSPNTATRRTKNAERASHQPESSLATN